MKQVTLVSFASTGIRQRGSSTNFTHIYLQTYIHTHTHDTGHKERDRKKESG